MENDNINFRIDDLLKDFTNCSTFKKRIKDKTITLIKSKKVYTNRDRSRTVFTCVNGVNWNNGLILWFDSPDYYEGSMSQSELFEYLQVDLKNNYSVTYNNKVIFDYLRPD